MIPVAAAPYPLVLAHRGGSEEAPENTLAAFTRLSDLGFRYIETDVHLSADGEVVVSHDETTDRTYGVPGKIRECTYAELAELRNEADEPIPRLADVLTELPHMYFVIDAKSDEVVEPLLEVLEETGASDRVMVASFSEKRLEKVREIGNPELSTSLGVGAVVRLLLASETVSNAENWHVPGPRHRARAAQVPEKNRGVRVVSPRFIATAHTAGLAVHVWTVNEREQMERLLDWGVDGIVTDRPSLLKEVLIERGQWGTNSGDIATEVVVPTEGSPREALGESSGETSGKTAEGSAEEGAGTVAAEVPLEDGEENR